MGVISISPRETPNDPSVKAYLKSISSYPLLTIEEEVELFEKMKSAPSEPERLRYREKIINSNLRFVVSVAKQYSSCKIPLMDLIQQWNIWLCKAADKYDSSRWFKFISYAVWRIRQSISQYVMSNKYDVKVPYNRLYICSKIEKIISEFIQTKWYEPTSEEILDFYVEKNLSDNSNITGLNLKIIKSTIDEYTSLLNLNATIHLNSTITGDTTTEFYEIIEDKNIPKTDDFVIQESLKNVLYNIIETLSYEQKYIIKSYFSENPESLSSIAEVLDIPISKVNKQKEIALKKIKYALLQTPDFADVHDYKKLELKNDENFSEKKPNIPRENIKNPWTKVTKKKATRKKDDISNESETEIFPYIKKENENSNKDKDLWATSSSKTWIMSFIKRLAKALWLQ